MKRREGVKILLADGVQTALDNFSACFGARVAYFGPDMRELKAGMRKPICEYCRLLRERLYGGARCHENDRARLREAMRKGSLLCYVCHAGLTEAIYPVMYEGVPAGYVMVGQFRVAKAAPARALRDWRAKFGSPTELVDAFEAVPEVSSARLPHFLGLFSMLVRFITSREMLSLEGDVLVGRTLDALRRKGSLDMSLSEAARLAGRSKSTVSHSFKAVLGVPFKKAVIDMRMDKAEELLTAGAGMNVKDVAARLGFKDAFYFSRLFKRRKGYPPSQAASKRGLRQI